MSDSIAEEESLEVVVENQNVFIQPDGSITAVPEPAKEVI